MIYTNDWCAYHHRDERYRYWFACGECLHAYRWPASLWIRHLLIWWRLDGPRGVLRHLGDRPSKIATCPLCAHDL